MTDLALAAPGARERTERRQAAPIVPPSGIGGHALIAVIAIMTFLSSLTLGAATLVRDTAKDWQHEIAREATVQIKPREGLDMEAALAATAAKAAAFPGVTGARVVDDQATQRLLEPWLGGDIDLAALPVPRLVIVTIDAAEPPDFAALQAALAADGHGAALDDHRSWADRLVAMAHSTVLAGLGVLGLILAATALCVVFATRGAMAGAGHVIDVLHFVGAEPRFIAGEFRRHFLLIGAKGAVAGGLLALLAFLAFGFWSSANLASPEASQAAALFGRFSVTPLGYAGVALIAAVVAALTAATSYLTVIAYLGELDMRQAPGG